MANRYSLETKMQFIQQHESGASIKALSQELQIPKGTLYHWVKEYRTIQTPERSYTPKEFDTLYQKKLKAEHELEIIRLSGLISNIHLQDKLAILEKLHQEHKNYSVHELCEALDVARGTFYNHIFRRADQTQRTAEQAQLMMQIQQIYDDSGQRFGAAKIRAVLSQHGVHVSTKRISVLMQEMGLQSIRPEAKKQYQKKQRERKNNLLKRDFTAEHPNQIWVSDITYFKLDHYGINLCAIIDLYSRKIVGYRISRRASTQLVTATFRTAFAERGNPTGLIFHSDRGGQYISDTFTKLLRKHNVTQSFSAPGCPHDNAVAESFFATFKKEEAYRKDYTSEQAFRKSVDTYIRFFNEKRPHQTLAYKTPAQFEEAYWRTHKDKI